MPEVERVPGDLETWKVGDTEFAKHFGQGSRSDRFLIAKTQSIIDLYAELCPRFREGRIFELGISAGGSTALISLLASPVKLVACDISPTPVPALTEFIDKKGLGASVRPYYGVDQGDRGRLAQILEDEFGDSPLDLVVDDASHTWVRTVASFEILFPRLRPGGVFVIEDWPSQYLMAETIASVQRDPSSSRYATFRARYEQLLRNGSQPHPPLAQLGVELMLAAVTSPDTIAEVSVNRHWLEVTRGPAQLDVEAFRIADLYSDHFGWLEQSSGEWWLRRVWDRFERSTS